jgi:hypothetical protein
MSGHHGSACHRTARLAHRARNPYEPIFASRTIQIGFLAHHPAAGFP